MWQVVGFRSLGPEGSTDEPGSTHCATPTLVPAADQEQGVWMAV